MTLSFFIGGSSELSMWLTDGFLLTFWAGGGEQCTCPVNSRAATIHSTNIEGGGG